jgi:hypothetical protein
MVLQKITALALVLAIISCGTTRYSATGPTDPRDLARYVLVVEETSGDQVTHTWKPAAEFDLARYQDLLNSVDAANLATPTSGPRKFDTRGEQCQIVYDRCWNRCMNTPVPSDFDHYIARHGEKYGKIRYCEDVCANERNACWEKLKRRSAPAHRFEAIDHAVDWVKRHRNELLLGSVVVIAGVAFVVIACGSSGCLLLVPVLLLASPEVPMQSYTAEADR